MSDAGYTILLKRMHDLKEITVKLTRVPCVNESIIWVARDLESTPQYYVVKTVEHIANPEEASHGQVADVWVQHPIPQQA